MPIELEPGKSDRKFFRTLLPLFVVAHWGHHLIGAMLTPLLPFIRDSFGLNYAQTGLMVTAYTLTYAISQLPSGRLADRVGPRIVITIAVAGTAVVGILIGLSSGYIMLAACLILLGMSGGGYHPSSVTMLSSLSGTANRGKVFGIHEIGGSTSFFTAPLIAGALVVSLGWHNVYIVVSSCVLILGIVLHIFLKRATSDTSFVPRANSAAQESGMMSSLKELAPFLILTIALSIIIHSIIYFIPLFMVDSFAIESKKASALLAILYSAGPWAGPLGGYLSDRFGKEKIIVLGTCLTGPAIYLITQVSYGWPMYLTLMLVGVCLFLTIPVGDSYVMSRVSERNRGTILGIYYFGRAGSGIVTPILGKLIDSFDFKPTFIIVAMVAFIITISCSIPIWKSRPQPASAQ